MSVATSSVNTTSFPTQLNISDDAHQKTNTHQRHRRSIDSSPPIDQQLVQEIKPAPDSSNGAYDEFSINPDPGKSVGVGQKVPVPVDLGPNINIDPITQKLSDSFKTVSQEASVFLKKKFAEMAEQAQTPAEKEKWNIDPDNTYLVTFDYNTTGKKPYPAKIIQRISLTQALIQNVQDTPSGKGYTVPFYPGGPEVIVKPDLKTITWGIFDFPSRFNPYSERAHTTHTFQGIYIEGSEGPAPIYNGGNQSSITPKEFKNLIWKADYQKPYKHFLNDFWSTHKEKYPVAAKASFIKSAMAQHQEGSLSSQGRELIMRAAGLSGHEESWPDINYEDLKKNPKKDPDIESGLLKIGNYQSTDLLYVTDTKNTPALTLLYIPGNSSPIHSFSSQAEMKTWLAKQMADPTKREAMASHFALKDKPNDLARAGIDETLAGLGAWPERRETPGGLFNYDHRAFSGYWNPKDFISTEPSSLPFDEITKRQKDRSYADADVQITSDADVTKKKILSDLGKVAKAALFLAPVALVVPEVALALDAFYLANGIATAGIGVDDLKRGKPEGTQRVVFGVLNAALVVTPHILKAAKGENAAANEVEQTTIKPGAKPEPMEPGVSSDVPRSYKAALRISHKQLKKKLEILHKDPRNQRLICYEASIRVGQAEKQLSPEVFDTVIGATNRRGGSNYSPAYLELMGIDPNNLQTEFNAADIPESGFLNFKHANEDGEFAHTVYIQRASDNKLYLFNTNCPELDLAMIKSGHPLEVSAGMTVYCLSNGKNEGLQNFLNGIDGKGGWKFAYTPASLLNANVKNLKG